MPSPKKPSDHKKKSNTKAYGAGWKGRSVLSDLELPSGELCQVKRPGVQGLIKAGVLHSLDTLTSIVQTETIPNAEGKPLPKASSVEAVMADPEKFGMMISQVDKIVSYVVVQPSIRVPKVTQDDIDAPRSSFEITDLDRELTDAERDALIESHPSDLIFTDWIDEIDKMFIMQFAVGGSASLAKFREDTQASLGSLHSGEAASPASE